MVAAGASAEAQGIADFTLGGYRDLVRRLLDRGYRATDYHSADPVARHLILRHDIDQSVRAARPIAEIEAGLGVTATYFVLVRTEMYNPGSRANRDDLAAIAGLGHEIGLHLDASLYPDEDAALERAAADECAVLQTLTGQSVRTLSFHRPARRLQGRAGTLAGRRHAYEPGFFTDMGYCSDSRGGWHSGHPLDHPAVAGGRALQLLTHPIWWQATVRYDGPVATLDRLRMERDRVFAAALAENCDPYRVAHGRDPVGDGR